MCIIICLSEVLPDSQSVTGALGKTLITCSSSTHLHTHTRTHTHTHTHTLTHTHTHAHTPLPISRSKMDYVPERIPTPSLSWKQLFTWGVIVEAGPPNTKLQCQNGRVSGWYACYLSKMLNTTQKSSTPFSRPRFLSLSARFIWL